MRRTNAFLKSILSSFTISRNLDRSLSHFPSMRQSFREDQPLVEILSKLIFFFLFFFFYFNIHNGMILIKKYRKLWLGNFFFLNIILQIDSIIAIFRILYTRCKQWLIINIKIMYTYIYIHMLQGNFKKFDIFVYIQNVNYT